MNKSSKKLIQDGQPHERRHPLAGGGVRITTFVPFHFRKRGIKKVVVAPDGIDQPVTVSSSPVITPEQDQALLKALGRAHLWQHLLDTGAMADTAEIARREGVHRATVNEVLRLALLAPDIVRGALDGTLPRTLSLETLLRTTFPLDWEKQRRMIASLG